MTKSSEKNISKLSGKLSLDNEPVTQCTKIEILPIVGQGTYAITLRFVLTPNFTLPPSFYEKKMQKLSYQHPNLPNCFIFDVEYLDMSIEDNPSFTELSIFFRGRKPAPAIIPVSPPQLIKV